MRRCALIISMLMVAGCASYEWAETASDGTKLAAARSECRNQAWENVRKSRPAGQPFYEGSAGLPIDSPVDMERREIDACLTKKGFRKVRTG